MLQKHRDTFSLPDGLCKVAEDIKKGSGVVRKLVSGEYVLALPTTAAEAADFYGFVTLDIESNEHKGSYYDTIPAGKRAVCYTRVPNNEWKTTEFVGDLAIGDKCCIGISTNAGKVVKAGATDTATLEVIGTIPAMAGYEEAMVIVKILPTPIVPKA